MKISELLMPQAPLRTFTLNMNEDEMGLLIRMLNLVEIPASQMEDRTRLWDMMTTLELAFE